MAIELKQYDSIPVYIQIKAWQEIRLLVANKANLNKWKALSRQKGLYRLKLNRNYRMVAKAQSLENGVFEIMKHSTFDKKY